MAFVFICGLTDPRKMMSDQPRWIEAPDEFRTLLHHLRTRETLEPPLSQVAVDVRTL
jgi:hypothetical protein